MTYDRLSVKDLKTREWTESMIQRFLVSRIGEDVEDRGSGSKMPCRGDEIAGGTPTLIGPAARSRFRFRLRLLDT